MVLAAKEGKKMSGEEIRIQESSVADLANIMSLWNNGEVMYYVGFPQGLGTTVEKLREWLPWAMAKPNRCHYSIYHRELGYCGETFYNVDSWGTAAMDIKLLPHTRGRGIARRALSFAIDKAFTQGGAQRVFVDPHPDNRPAWRLYAKLGFISKERPDYLGEGETYLEIDRASWAAKA
jgi:RimJ/RimL family protein N-acetyltransferase